MKLTNRFRNVTRPARHWVIGHTIDFLFWSFRRLPEGLALLFGAGLGDLAYLLGGPNRHLAFKHLEEAYGDEMGAAQRRHVVREMYRNIGRSAAENAHSIRENADFIRNRFKFVDEDVLLDCYRQGKGLVVVTAHLDNWEMAGSALARLLNLPVVGVARPQSDKVFEGRLSDLRSKMGIEVFSRGNDARALLRSLREEKVLIFLLDQDTSGSGCFVPFFGKQAFTLTGPATLALRAGAPMIVGYSRRLADGVTHEIRVSAVIQPPETGDRKADAREMTRQATAYIEQAVRQSPDQWVWFHRRWKTRPPTETAVKG